jgi:pyrimidine-nucleoside phosphorylase
MRAFDIIKQKRDGKKLTKEQIDFFIKGYVSGDIKDYQASALLMAIYFNGMDVEETTNLTLAIRDSGKTLSFDKIDGLKADKHSTGGVGDKTSLVVAPIVASLGLKVAKMSGRGLGHTGGTVDKLESISGYKTDISIEEFQKIVNETGMSIIGQSAELAPADKLLYALRDVTATIDSMPLIASSIMGKKLAANDDIIVLDVKTGSGSFMKSVEESEKLSKLMVEIGKNAGKKILALITDMSRPLGNAIGNSLEVIEAIETLNGGGPEDFTNVCIMLASNMLYLAGKGTIKECEEMVKDAISSKKALKTFANSVKMHGGDDSLIYDVTKFERAKFKKEVLAPATGYIEEVDCEGYGVASLMLGAGRNTKEDEIDYLAGIILNKKTGDFVQKGEMRATLYTSNERLFDSAEKKFLSSTIIGSNKPTATPLVYKIIE